MNPKLTAIAFQDYVQTIQRIPGGNDMDKQTITDVLRFFASSVNLFAPRGKEWQPSEYTEKPEGVIQNASRLGLIATTPDEGIILITELGRNVKEKMNRIFGN